MSDWNEQIIWNQQERIKELEIENSKLKHDKVFNEIISVQSKEIRELKAKNQKLKQEIKKLKGEDND